MQVAVGVARSPGGEARCTYCHTSIGQAEALAVCAGCGATLHDTCRRELRRCPTPGCERAPRLERRAADERPRGERRAVRIKDADELAEAVRRDREVQRQESERVLRLLILLPVGACLGSIGLVALLQGARGLIVAGAVGLVFTLAAARDLWRERAQRALAPALRVAMLVLGPAALGFALGSVVGAPYPGACLAALVGLGACIQDAAPPTRP